MHFYETSQYEPGDIYTTLTAHDTLESAIEFAEAHNITTIYEIGGNHEEFEKCSFCGEWFPLSDLNINNECFQCEQAIKSHGG